MGYPNKTLQSLVDVSNAIDKALQDIKLPEGFSIETSSNVIYINKNMLAIVVAYPKSKMEPNIQLNQ